MLLLTDGTVMVKSSSGGSDGYGNLWNKLTPDSQGSYANGTWTTLAAMHDTRLYFASQVLKDGRVFVAGGEYGTGGSAGETYDPLANTWTSAPTQSQRISDANSEILPDGRVLVALVTGTLRSTIIFDPVANTWTAGPNANGIHNESAWVKLPDASSLMVDRLSTNSERYVPSLNQWVVDAMLPVALYDSFGDETGPGFLLPDGRAFFIGSPSNTAYYTPSGSTSPGTWAAGPAIPSGQGAPDAPGAMMPNGRILCALSPTPTSANHFPSPTAFYEFDYTGNTWTSITAPGGGSTINGPSYIFNMLDLPDGTVLYSQQGSSQYYVYSPGGTPLAAGKPAINSISQNADGSFHLTGTGLNGISEGAAYGDDWQMATNYPIVRLTSGANVYYPRTYAWSNTGVVTGSTPVTTEFTVPASVPFGTYSLVVVANGISSDAVSFTFNGNPILAVTPSSGLSASGNYGGPFTPGSISHTLTNNGTGTLHWTAANTASWLSLSSSSGAIAAGGNTMVTATINSNANVLLTGSYSDTVTFTNSDNGNGNTTRGVSLAVGGSPAMTVTPSGSYSPTGNYGGPFTPASMSYTVTNSGTSVMDWTAAHSAGWLTLSATGGSLVPGANATVVATINSGANSLPAGTFNDTISFTNVTNAVGNATRAVSLTVSGNPVLSVSPSHGLNSSGGYGGPFNPGTLSFTLSNTGTSPLNWTAARTTNWLTLSPASGTLGVGGSVTVTATINASANSLAVSTYSDMITFNNSSNYNGSTTRPVSLTVFLPAPVIAAEPPSTGGSSNTISWSAVNGANQYEAQYSTSTNFATSVSSGLVSGTSFTFNGLSEGLIYYRVRSSMTGSPGVVSAWSTVVSSRQDSTMPTLAVTSSTSTMTSSITLNGTASDLSGIQNVTVAGNPAQTSDGHAHWTATLTNLANGTTPVTVTASDNASPPNVRTLNLSVTRLTDADQDGLPDFWQDQYGLTGADRSPTADPDHDNINNLLEYAFDMDPTKSDTAGLPVGTVAVDPADGKRHLMLSYRRWIGGGGLQYVVEVSTDLVNWSSTDSDFEANGAPVPDANGVTEVVNLWINPSTDLVPRKTVRLHISVP